MEIRTYKQALDYLEGFIGKIIFKIDKEFLKKHDPLERMRTLLSLLGNPETKFKSVLVGGTSGKGSTAYLISHILTTAGFKTGLTLSPHLQKINERLQINGKEITDKKFVEMINLVVPAIKKMSFDSAQDKLGGPSYFEILVGMAFKHFADQKVDIAVVEVGMGGEFDGTNTLNPLIAILTNVGLDHTNILGKTVGKIAKTKAGIIKKGAVVVSGVKQLSVIKIVEDRCKKVGAELNLLWREFGYKIKKESASGIEFDFISHEETLDTLTLSLLGQYQAENASLGIKTILELRKFGFKISDKVIRKALKTAFFAGRFEVRKVVLRQAQDKISSTLILDGAHNPTKMKKFLKSLKKIFPPTSPSHFAKASRDKRLRGTKKIFIIGFKFDKDIKKMLKEILGVADEIIVTQFKAKTDTNLHASAEAIDIKSQILKIKSDTKVVIEKDSGKALEKAFKMKTEIIVVTGSLYLVGEIRNKIALF